MSGPKTVVASAAPPVVIVVVVDDAAAAAETDVAGCASFGLSIEPVSLKPDPLLGFLSRDGVMRKERGKKRFSRLKKISKFIIGSVPESSIIFKKCETRT